MEPRIQYARTSDGVNIAYYGIGDGAPLVYLPGGGSLSHLALEWQYPEQREWLTLLAAKRRLIRLDHRGVGLSDDQVDFDLEVAALDIEAVARKEGLNRFALLGQLHSAGTALIYASQHPETVSHLVLWCPFVSHRHVVEHSRPLKAAHAAGAIDWPTFTELIAQQATGWSDMDQARRFAAYLRQCASADRFLAACARFEDFDAAPKLRELSMPVLILHRRGAAFPAVHLIRKLAASTPGARLVLLEGSAVSLFLGDTDAVLAAIEQFLGEGEKGHRPDGLTERELEILALLAGGSSNEGITRALSISRRTVERHIGNIYLKIGAHNRAEATAHAYRNGIVPSSQTHGLRSSRQQTRYDARS